MQGRCDKVHHIITNKYSLLVECANAISITLYKATKKKGSSWSLFHVSTCYLQSIGMVQATNIGTSPCLYKNGTARTIPSY